jgi:predicted alpha/beta-fold hydrolase
MGGNLICKYAGTMGDRCNLDGIISISNPFDLIKSNQLFSTPLRNFLYSSYLCRCILDIFKGLI